MGKKKLTPKQAASASTLDRWQKDVDSALALTDAASPKFNIGDARGVLTRLKRSMERAERR